MTLKIGQGVDVHAFDDSQSSKASTHITLGGVVIPSPRPLLAHSDGDVLIHALCDALLGALALGDIGLHFPDNDERYKNADSRKLLQTVIGLLNEQGYMLLNADMTIVAQQPKMAPHTLAMRNNLAADMAVAVEAVSVKATTTEHLGFTGREEGIACFAIVLLQKRSGD